LVLGFWWGIPTSILLTAVVPAKSAFAQEEVTVTADPETGEVRLPDPGPQPGYPQAHLWRPLALEQWQVEIPAEARLGLDSGATLEPIDVVFGASLGVLDQLQTSVLLDLRAAPAPATPSPPAPASAAEVRIAQAMEFEATYAVYTSGTSAFSLAGSVWFWLTLRPDPVLLLAPTLVGVWRIARLFGLRAALTVPLTLQIKGTKDDLGNWLWRESVVVDITSALSAPYQAIAGAKEAVLFVLRPEFQPFEWMWLGVGAGIGVRGSDDLIVPLDFELGFTPWGPIDVYANFVFPDIQSLGPDSRMLTLGLRGRI
jgi:hypothetical protein